MTRPRLRTWLAAPVDLAWLAALRIIVGAMACWSALRFLAYGWVDTFFCKPSYFFDFWGFDWLPHASCEGMTAIFVALAIASACVMIGCFYRVTILTTCVLLTYVELLDVTNYLNHYYLLSLLTFLLCWLPAHGMGSMDARRRPHTVARGQVARWAHVLCRAQVAIVYFWAGVAKLGSDWLLHAQPLNIWLLARQETPIVGALFGAWPTALVMSWAGFLFDTTIWAFVLWPRTRRAAYVVVIGFHLMTGVLFNIGLFPFIMMGAATVFFAPSWPRRLKRSAHSIHAEKTKSIKPVTSSFLCLIALYLAIQMVAPARHWLYPGDVLWHEQGMRWAWKVMVREKNGAITYRVRWRGRDRPLHVPPTRYLTDHQAREFSGQPDMILQLAHHIGGDYRARGHEDVQVYVDAIVSLNGRSPHAMIDPNVDLMTLEDGVGAAPWIMPAPSEPPPHLGRATW